MLKKTMLAVTLVIAFASTAHADSREISRQIAGFEDGLIRMTFDARKGVCGDGRNHISFKNGDDEWSMSSNGITHFSSSGDDDDTWHRDCESGPVHVSIRVRHGEIGRIRTYVGGEWGGNRKDILDLGHVDSRDAGEFMLKLVTTVSESAAEDLVLPAILARDFVAWPRLLELARDRNLEEGVRSSCVFWLGQAAGEKATKGLVRLVDNDDVELEVRKSAIFALSQQGSSTSSRHLRDIALTNKHPQLRKSAMFWLAESGDEIAVALFEEILTGN